MKRIEGESIEAHKVRQGQMEDEYCEGLKHGSGIAYGENKRRVDELLKMVEGMKYKGETNTLSSGERFQNGVIYDVLNIIKEVMQ